jgi:opacity protein-like surface antigen
MRSLVFSLLAVPVFGQVFEVGLHGGVNRYSGKDIGTFRVTDTARITLEDGWRFGFRTTFNNYRFFGHELGYAYNRTQFRLNDAQPLEYGTAIHQGFYNFLAYATAEGSRIRPFAAGGAHFSNFIWPGQSVTYGGGSTKLGYNYGGGVKVRITPIFALRLDFRQYVTGKPFDLPNQSGRFRQNEISAGFSLVL